MYICFPDQEKLLSRQGQQGWNRLFDLLQSELAVRPADVHVNIKLVELYSKDGRLDEAVKHCLSHENKGQLRKSLDWNSLVVDTLQVSHYVFWIKKDLNKKRVRFSPLILHLTWHMF